jgi:hypothetical protein
LPDKEFIKILDKIGHDRLRVKLKTEKGKLIDIVYQYESFINSKWFALVRYDCSHGFFHRDVILPNGDKEKYEIIIKSLKDASSYAEQDIKDRWEWYKEKFVKKLKVKK